VKFHTLKHENLHNHGVCLCEDGCLQERIAAEVCSLVGHWKLDTVILIFDSNDITLDAEVEKSQRENLIKRFEACWLEVTTTNGNDLEDFIETFNHVKLSKMQCPELIVAKTKIGLGIDEAVGTNETHGTAGIKFLAEAKQRVKLPQ
jgi:transketolase